MKKMADIILSKSLYVSVYIISLIPMCLLYKLSRFIYTILFSLVSYRRQIVIQNLSRSFPDKNYLEIESIMKKFYSSFCDNFVEILKTISISPIKQANKITVVNQQIIFDKIERGQNIIVSMGHCGNWEILNILPFVLGVNCYAVYKPLKINILNNLFLKLRSRFGLELIPAKSVVRHFLSNKNSPSLYFFLADQCPKIVDEKYKFIFLHQQTSAYSGVEKLARLTNSAVLYIQIIRKEKGLYQVDCIDIASNPLSISETNITQKYIQLLEINIKAQPYSWLWTHKRWKR